MKIDPPPSKVELVKEPRADAIWKLWLYNAYEVISALFVSRTQHYSMQNAHFGKGTTAPTQVTVGNYNGWEFDIGDDSVFTIELGHDVDESKAIRMDFSMVINEAYATRSAKTRWRAVYSCTPHDNGESILAPTHTGTLTTADLNIPALAYHPQHTISLAIPAGSYAHGDIIGVTFSRIALTAGANPVAKPIILSMHFEYTMQTTDWAITN